MIEEIKKIMIEDLQLESKKISQQIELKKAEMRRLQSKLDNLQNGQLYPVVQQRFNFIQRHITRRKEYKKYQEISSLKKQLDLETTRLNDDSEMQKLLRKENQNYDRIYTIKNKTKSLGELGIDVQGAVNLLESRGIPVVLTEADKGISYHERDYSSKSSLIGVHKTHYAPVGSQIRTLKNTNTINENIIINGQEYGYSYRSERDTIHMAMNDEVSSHSMGGWDSCKYSILIPMTDIPNERIGQAASVDTFVKGDLQLTPNTWILCPNEEVGKIRNNNPNVHVIGYEGDTALGYSPAFLSALGYRAEEVGAHLWHDNESQQQYNQLMQKEGLGIGLHSYTYFGEDEDVLTEINENVAVFDMIATNDLVKSKKDIPNVLAQLEANNINFNKTFSFSMFEDGKYPEAILANHKQMDIFFIKMQEKGITIPDSYQTIFKRIARNYKDIWNGENIDATFQGLEGLSSQDKNLIDQLKESLAIGDKFEKEKTVSKFMITAVLDSVVRTREERKMQQYEQEFEQEVGHTKQELLDLGFTESEINELTDKFDGETGEKLNRKNVVESAIQSKRERKEKQGIEDCFEDNGIRTSLVQDVSRQIRSMSQPEKAKDEEDKKFK